MDTNDERSLIPVPDRSLASPTAGAERILSAMVGETLALARDTTVERIDLDELVREAKRIQRCEGMTPEDIQAFGLFLQAATGGHPEAQYHLRHCYLHGYGIQEDRKLALEWLTKAAESGFAAAQYLLREHDDGWDDDYFDLFDMALFMSAVQGDADAQCEIAQFYCGIVRGLLGHVRAAEWYTEAAVSGSAEAQFELGLCLSGGTKDRTPGDCRGRDFMKQFFCWEITKELRTFLHGQKVPFDVLNARTGEVIIPGNQEISMPMVRKLAKEHDQVTTASSVIVTSIGNAVAIQKRKAAKWFRRAAEQGHGNARRHLALCYQFGDGVKADLAQAFAWLQLYADEMDDLAQWMLARVGFLMNADKDAEAAKKEAAALVASMSGSELETAQNLYRNLRELYFKKR